MHIAEEYKKSLKMAEAEEILDLILYRPIAFVIVKLIYRFPVTPNQITYGALIAGLLSAFQFSKGTPSGFAWGGVWFAFANVLDCGDGMLARLQNSGTPLGRMIDGTVDWLSSIAIFFGLGMGVSAYFSNSLYWVLAIAAGSLSGYHAMVFDKRQQEYISAVRGEKNLIERESEKVGAELNKGNNPIRKLFLAIYARYMKVQEGGPQQDDLKVYPPDTYRRFNKRIMRWWTFLGPTTNRSLLIIAGLVAHPEWFCWTVLIPLNLYLVSMFIWQKQVTRHMDEMMAAPALHAAPRAA